MSDTVIGADSVPARNNYLNDGYTVRSWLLSTDHKRVAILYLMAVTLFFFFGGAAAVIFRLHLMTPTGALVQPELYNKLFTTHGLVMVFFFLIPSVPAVLGNFLVPLMIGAKDLAFPRFEPGQLVRLYERRIAYALRDIVWRCRHGG